MCVHPKYFFHISSEKNTHIHREGGNRYETRRRCVENATDPLRPVFLLQRPLFHSNRSRSVSAPATMSGKFILLFIFPDALHRHPSVGHFSITKNSFTRTHSYLFPGILRTSNVRYPFHYSAWQRSIKCFLSGGFFYVVSTNVDLTTSLLLALIWENRVCVRL